MYFYSVTFAYMTFRYK